MSNKFVVNLDKLLKKLEKLENPKAAINKGIEKGCLLVEGTAKQNCPVDTGNLRASITHEVNEGEGIVGTNVEYASFVEFGTSKQAPQPYLYPALEQNKEKILEFISKEIEREVE